VASDPKNIIGTGWAFPPSFDLNTKRVQTVTGIEDIKQSLNILFGTSPGERVLEQSYGCDLNSTLFHNITLSEKTLLENNIKEAIIDFEGRIVVDQVKIDTSQALDGVIHIQIAFTLDQTNNRHNIIYPFFITEGTLITKEIF